MSGPMTSGTQPPSSYGIRVIWSGSQRPISTFSVGVGAASTTGNVGGLSQQPGLGSGSGSTTAEV